MTGNTNPFRSYNKVSVNRKHLKRIADSKIGPRGGKTDRHAIAKVQVRQTGRLAPGVRGLLLGGRLDTSELGTDRWGEEEKSVPGWVSPGTRGRESQDNEVYVD